MATLTCDIDGIWCSRIYSLLPGVSWPAGDFLLTEYPAMDCPSFSSRYSKTLRHACVPSLATGRRCKDPVLPLRSTFLANLSLKAGSPSGSDSRRQFSRSGVDPSELYFSVFFKERFFGVNWFQGLDELVKLRKLALGYCFLQEELDTRNYTRWAGQLLASCSFGDRLWWCKQFRILGSIIQQLTLNATASPREGSIGFARTLMMKEEGKRNKHRSHYRSNMRKRSMLEV